MAQRYSTNRSTHWEVGFWLIFNADGSVRMTRSEPNIFGFERAMLITANIPHSLFKVPQLSGKITFGESSTEPVHIDIEAAETALTEALGARVELIVKGEDHD